MMQQYAKWPLEIGIAGREQVPLRHYQKNLQKGEMVIRECS